MKYSNFFRLFGIVLFIYVLSKINISELMITFKGISAKYYLAAILFLIFGFLLRTLKWKILIDNIGSKASFKDLVKIMLKSVFLGMITPAKVGEFWRAKYLAEASPISGGKALCATFIDRLMDLLVVGLVALFGLIFFYFRFGDSGRMWEIPVLIFVIFTFFSAFILKKIGLQKAFRIFIGFFIPTLWREKTDVFLDEFDQGLVGLSSKLFLKVFSYGFLYYLVAVTSYYFMTLALEISTPFWYLFLIVAIVWLVLILPITIFGLGTRETVFIYFFSLLGISAPVTVAFSLLTLFSNILILALPGVILFLNKSKT